MALQPWLECKTNKAKNKLSHPKANFYQYIQVSIFQFDFGQLDKAPRHHQRAAGPLQQQTAFNQTHLVCQPQSQRTPSRLPSQLHTPHQFLPAASSNQALDQHHRKQEARRSLADRLCLEVCSTSHSLCGQLTLI
jgi:hypothetical protein